MVILLQLFRPRTRRRNTAGDFTFARILWDYPMVTILASPGTRARQPTLCGQPMYLWSVAPISSFADMPRPTRAALIHSCGLILPLRPTVKQMLLLRI